MSGVVQGKIDCLYRTVVSDGQSAKRPHQSFQVMASDVLAEGAEEELTNAVATEKLDGTSCYVRTFEGQPWLWARRDRRPTKSAEKRFRKFHASADVSAKMAERFKWDMKTDFKDIPDNWIPAEKVTRDAAGNVLPNSQGHIMGWVPVDMHSRTHCWHLTAVDLNRGIALVLRPQRDDPGLFELTPVGLAELEGTTLELIGTYVNGNPYGLGSKSQPIHVFVQHGIIPAVGQVPTQLSRLREWFEGDGGKVEGVVWHCDSGRQFKVHRHHLNLPWPLPTTRLATHPLVVSVDPEQWSVFSDAAAATSFQSRLSEFNGVRCQGFNNLARLLEPDVKPEQ